MARLGKRRLLTTGKRVELRTSSVDDVLAALDAARPAGAAAIAFDADGTLWSGDVGEDVFEFAAAGGALREVARAPLARTASEHSLDAGGSASELGLRILAGFRSGRVSTLTACEVMTWGWAGFDAAELREVARHALGQRNFARRLQRELEPVLSWARRSGVRAIVISASPLPIVEQAAALWGFQPPDLVAAEAQFEDGRVVARMAAPVPYADEKVVQGKQRMGDATWLGSFADNVYDLDMLRVAKLGVAVRPKLALRERLPGEPAIVVLE